MLDYLRLFRIPNVFTAIADSAMALAVAGVVGVSVISASGATSSAANYPALALLFLATILLYTSGMVLNDVFDFEQDLKERPQRPLPSGKIDRGFAKQLGFVMWGAGGVAAPLAVWLQGGDVRMALVFTVCLMASILVYDAGGKRSYVGPYIMGSCRSFNILTVLCMGSDRFGSSGLSVTAMWMLSGGIGIYIAGITWFARTEAQEASHRGMLVFALVHMVAGIALVMTFPDMSGDDRKWYLPSTTHFFLLIMILAIPVVRRAAIAIGSPTPERVQQTIKQGIFSLIVFDAGIAMMVTPIYYSLAILFLLVPTLTLGKWIYAT
jgi:4-hydroxybenzoate polyprenyltransferase